MPRHHVPNVPPRRADSARRTALGLFGALAAGATMACAAGGAAPASDDAGDDAGAGAPGVEPSVTLSVRALSPDDGRMLDALMLEPLQTVKLGATAKPAVDRFFDDVMVMADDPAVRANRLALLRGVAATMNRVADISKLAA